MAGNACILFTFALRTHQYVTIILSFALYEKMKFVDEKVGRSFSRRTVNSFNSLPCSPSQLYRLFIEYCYICNM